MKSPVLHLPKVAKAAIPLSVAVVGVVIGASVWPIVGVIPCALAFALLSFLYPFGVLVGMIAVLPVAPYVQLPLPVHDVFALARFVLFLTLFVRKIMDLESFNAWLIGHAISRTLLLYTLVAGLSLFVFNRPASLSLSAFMRWLSYVCGYYCITALATSGKRILLILKTLCISTLVVGIFAFYQFAIGEYSQFWKLLYPVSSEGVEIEPWSGRVTSVFIHFNSFAAYLNLVLPFSVALWLYRKDRLSMWVSVVSVIALVLTQSRGGLAGFIAIITVFIWARSGSKVAFIKRFIMAAVVGGVTLFAIGAWLQRFATIDENALTRFGIWAAAYTLFRSSPWIGVGFGNFKELYGPLLPMAYPRVLDAHNLYLQLLSETGIVGLIAFFALIVTAISIAKQKARLSGIEQIVGVAALGAISGVLAHGLVDYVFHVCPPFAALFGFVLGLLSVQYRTHQTSPQRLPGDVGQRRRLRFLPTVRARQPADS